MAMIVVIKGRSLNSLSISKRDPKMIMSGVKMAHTINHVLFVIFIPF
jgi:hypothetical protein